MERLIEELNNIDNWDSAFNRLCSKPRITAEMRNELWKYKELHKDEIVEQIINGSYEWSIPRKVEIAKHESNKKRVVYIYELKDRLVLGVLYRACSNAFKDTISERCYSYKKGQSTGKAVDYVRDHRVNKNNIGVKVDIHAYFNSVNKNRVKEMIENLFDRGIKNTIEKLMLDDRVYWKNEIIREWKSLIPGSALSSFFANYCLCELDNYFEEESKETVYARYSDDIIILEDSKEKLDKDLDIIKNYLKEYELEINPDKYTWFEAGEDVEFLGLKINSSGKIDISDHAKFKIKKQIHRWCRKGRKEIEMNGKDFKDVGRKIFKRINNKNFKCYIRNEGTFGWCHYAFSRINTEETLVELDRYLKDTMRAMKTGKHNKANGRAITEEEFKELGYVSLVQLFHLFKNDFDYYLEIIDLI